MLGVAVKRLPVAGLLGLPRRPRPIDVLGPYKVRTDYSRRTFAELREDHRLERLAKWHDKEMQKLERQRAREARDERRRERQERREVLGW